MLGLVPAIHWTIASSTQEERDLFLVRLFGMFGLYGAGLAVYLARVPERWAPGSFDTLGSSHQWWHLFVLAAQLLWITGMEEYYQAHRHGKECPAGAGAEMDEAQVGFKGPEGL